MHLDEPPDALAGLVAEINTTPLTDVFLVLLIVFMVSSTAMVDAARQGQLDVSLPTARASTQGTTTATTLIIGVLADGRCHLQGRALSLEDLAPRLQEAYRKDAATVVVVDADGAVEHRHVVAVIDRVRGAGFQTVAIGAQSAP